MQVVIKLIGKWSIIYEIGAKNLQIDGSVNARMFYRILLMRVVLWIRKYLQFFAKIDTTRFAFEYNSLCIFFRYKSNESNVWIFYEIYEQFTILRLL